MIALEERFQASQPVLARLGRVDADGVPVPNATMLAISPDQWRIIREACFGSLWTRPGLSMEQRSLATISVITVLRRDDNLKGHLHSGLDVGFSASADRRGAAPADLLRRRPHRQHGAGARL